MSCACGIGLWGHSTLWGTGYSVDGGGVIIQYIVGVEYSVRNEVQCEG